MHDRTARGAAKSAVIVLTSVLLCGAASTPGGCNSNVKASSKVGLYQCDTAPGGVNDCDESDRVPGSQQPAPGSGCGVTSGAYLYCGLCESPRACKYCPEDAYCPLDPCSTECPTDISYAYCPDDDYPILCADKSCCPRGYLACCKDTDWCGTSRTACDDEVDNIGGTTSGGGGGCDYPAGCSSGTWSSSVRDGCCWDLGNGGCMDACGDDCGNAWYEIGTTVYGPCAASDTACMNQAVADAFANCK